MTYTIEQRRQYHQEHLEEERQRGRQYYQSHKEERSQYWKRWYQVNAEKRKRYHKERLEDFRKWKEIAGPCKNCGEKDGRCLEFHHFNSDDKKFEINVGQWYRRGLIELVEELAKCEALCSNCHKKEEFDNGAWK